MSSDLPAWLTSAIRPTKNEIESNNNNDDDVDTGGDMMSSSSLSTSNQKPFLGIGNKKLLSLLPDNNNNSISSNNTNTNNNNLSVPAGWGSIKNNASETSANFTSSIKITHTRQPPPGPQHFGLVDPPRRQLYRMMIRQLLSDGHSDAAMAIARSTGVLVSNPGANPQQLLDLVQTGITASRFLLSSSANGKTESYIEDVIYGNDPYSAYDLPAQNSFDFREWYVSKSFECPVRCLDFHRPSGKTCVVGTANGDVRIYSVPLADEFARSASSAELQTPTDAALIRSLPGLHPGHSVEAVGLHPSEPLCVSGGRDGRLVFTKYGQVNSSSSSIGGRNQSNNHQHQQQAYQNLGGQNIAGNSGTTGGSRVVSIHNDTYAVRCLDFHPSGDVVLFGTDHNAPRLFHLETGSVFTPSVVTSEVSVAVSSPISTTTGTGFNHSRFRGRNATTFETQLENVAQKQVDPNVVHLGSITDVAYSADGRNFASSSFDGSVRVFDGRQGSEVVTFAKAHCGVAVTSVQFSKSGYMILTGGLDSQVRLWDIRKPQGGNEVAAFATTGTAPKKLSFHTRAKCCFSFDEHSIVTTNSTFQGLLYVDAATMRVTSSIDYWNPESSRLRNNNSNNNGGANASDAYGYDKDVTGAQAGSAANEVKNGIGGLTSGVVRAVASSPNRCLLAAGGDDMRLKFWAPMLTTMRN